MSESSAARAWLMVRDGQIINRVLWDGRTESWSPPPGVEMVLADESEEESDGP